MKRNYFEELNKSLDKVKTTCQWEAYLSRIADKIVWCWKWRKITDKEKDILCDRVIQIYKEM